MADMASIMSALKKSDLTTIYIADPLFCDLEFIIGDDHIAVSLAELAPRSNIVSKLAIDTQKPYNSSIRTHHALFPPKNITTAGITELLMVKLRGKKLKTTMVYEYITAASYLGMNIDEVDDCHFPRDMIGERPSKEDLMAQVPSLTKIFDELKSDGQHASNLYCLGVLVTNILGPQYIHDNFGIKTAMNILHDDHDKFMKNLKSVNEWKDKLYDIKLLRKDHWFHIYEKSWQYILAESTPAKKFLYQVRRGHESEWYMLTSEGVLMPGNGRIDNSMFHNPTLLHRADDTQVMVHWDSKWKYSRLVDEV